MIDFDVQRCTRKCAALNRELRPGETFFSALVRDGAEIVRRDFSEEAWTGPPNDAIGWWKSPGLEESGRRRHWAPNDVLRHFFRQLEHDDERADLRYVAALLMVRRKLMRLDRTETDELGVERLVLVCPQEERECAIPVCTPTPQRIQEIQEELGRLLFAD